MPFVDTTALESIRQLLLAYTKRALEAQEACSKAILGLF